ncbi:uncharacterized protein DS421_16g532440 [Arachis hypogaea]|nr:uncharacterized protein DS421_16g532440 [Arachis hypogaea]
MATNNSDKQRRQHDGRRAQGKSGAPATGDCKQIEDLENSPDYRRNRLPSTYASKHYDEEDAAGRKLGITAIIATVMVANDTELETLTKNCADWWFSFEGVNCSPMFANVSLFGLGYPA